MVYATRPNNRIRDDGGQGGSLLAKALVRKLTADTAIRVILGDVADDMAQAQGNRLAPNYQALDSSSDVSSDGRNEWCIMGCKFPGGASTAMPRWSATSLQRVNFWRAPASPLAVRLSPAVAIQRQSEMPPDSASPQTIVRDYKRYRPTAPRKVLVRISWCSGDPMAQARYVDARHAFEALTASLSQANRVRGQSQIYGVQLIDIPPETNRLAVFQRRSDAEYVDPVKTDRDENMLADTYLRTIKGGLPVRGTDFPTPNVVDLSYCRGAYTGPVAPLALLQVLKRTDLPAAAKLWTILNERVPELRVIPKTEVMIERPDWSTKAYPAATIVRFSDPASQGAAKHMADVISAAIRLPVGVERVKPGADAKRKQDIEVWIGSAPDARDRISGALAPFSSETRF